MIQHRTLPAPECKSQILALGLTRLVNEAPAGGMFHQAEVHVVTASDKAVLLEIENVGWSEHELRNFTVLITPA
jgi:hypothetical protein